MSLRVAVTGASGFIGQHVTAALSSRGDAVLPVARPFELSALAAAFRQIDAVVHLAGVISAVRTRDYVSGNVEATRVVAQAARDAGARLVHVSSLAAAGPAPASAPRSEDDPPTPITTYGRTKLEGEGAVAATSGLHWTILRPGVVYGPGDRALRPLFRWARLGVLPVVGGDSTAYTFIYVDDAVRAILAALDRGRAGDTIFLGHAQPVTTRSLVATIQAVGGPSAWLLQPPRPIVRIAATLGDLAGTVIGKPATINSRRYTEIYSAGFVCRVGRMRDHLGVVAETDLRQGLNQAADWYVTRTR
jgi:nucleoside-diphosphate-sugar epimerase